MAAINIAKINRDRKQRSLYLLGVIFVVVGLVLYWALGGEAALCYLASLGIAELLAYMVVRYVGIPNGVFATEKYPRITQDIVNRFAAHGYDPELGWVRKANTSKMDCGCLYKIDNHGSRMGYEEEHTATLVSTYGDSYTFCRECEDKETWQYYLGDRLKSRVLNFGVGNYGFDQSLIRLKREFPKCPTPVVVIGVVPQTIARILSVWKHFNEYGNILAFKPCFRIVDDELVMIENPVDCLDRYYHLDSLMDDVQDNDYFYSRRFVRESARFPFLLSTIYNHRRLYVLLLKVLRAISLRVGFGSRWLDSKIVLANKSEDAWQSADLYKSPDAVELLDRLVDAFVDYSRQNEFAPILLVMPMKDDLIYMKRFGHYYKEFLDRIEHKLTVIDMAEKFIREDNIESLFRRWHYSPTGNKLVADELGRCLDARGLTNVPAEHKAHAE